MNNQEKYKSSSKNIKQEPTAEFVCILPPFESEKTLGGSLIIVNVKEEKRHLKELSENLKDEGQDQGLLKSQCKICRKILASEQNLILHMNIHNKVECDVCFQVFQRKTIEKHKKKHINEGKRKFLCDLCPKRFLKEKTLYDHRIQHRRNFQCDLCGCSTLSKISITSSYPSHP